MTRKGAGATAVLLNFFVLMCRSQSPRREIQDEVQRLSEAMSKIQNQIDQSQHELAEMRVKLDALRGGDQGTAKPIDDQSGSRNAAELGAAVVEIEETQSVHASQIATLEQAKVESESKYPVKVSGLALMTVLISTQGVDSAISPTIAEHGAGSTAATVRQTMAGLSVRGPHVFGALSRGDVSIDFAGVDETTSYGGNNFGTPRLRTAHAELDWEHSKAYFALDRPLLSQESPTSLVAVAQPPLGWSGNLWAWTPQVGASYDFGRSSRPALRVQGALIDVADAPASYADHLVVTSAFASTAQQSRWPGMETRLTVVGGKGENAFEISASGYISPHRVSSYFNFDSWAAALDFDVPTSRLTRLAGSAYRGLALGGLGGGAFKDYVERTEGDERYFRALEDVGGWAQWKQRLSDRLEFNEAAGFDNVPGHELRPYAATDGDSYYNLVRNRTISGNMIYRPNLYWLISLEYRRIASSFVNSPTEFSDILGLSTGLRF